MPLIHRNRMSVLCSTFTVVMLINCMTWAKTSLSIPNGALLPWKMENNTKVFHLIAEPIKQVFAPGLTVNCWGYNGMTPGPVIEATEGDRVRILVTNKLPEKTAIHWHGIFLPNGMDGVAGLTQPPIEPGETFAYEFTLRQHGTFMYHPHSDEMTQMAMGLMGFFIVHPKNKKNQPDRDFLIFLHEWAIKPGAYTPDPNVMLDFNYFTFNGKVFPATAPLVVNLGQKVRVRLGNVSMDNHPIHLHGFSFKVTATDGGEIPILAQWPNTTVDVPPGSTRNFEFVADAEGDWPLHCHKTHHTMSGMEHGLPNVIGVDQSGVEDSVHALLPGYMAMGSTGMSGMAEMGMAGPANYPGMGSAPGPFATIEMGGMFTLVKIRKDLKSFNDPPWYKHPEGTVAWLLKDTSANVPQQKQERSYYTCPMHPKILEVNPGSCPKCGMNLVKEKNDQSGRE